MVKTVTKMNILHFPKLDSIFMVENAIQNSEDYPTRMELWKSLPKQMQYQTFKLILDYLERSNKIMFEGEKIIWIFANSKELFELKIKIEKELSIGNKTNENLYQLINKSIYFLKQKRVGVPISKKLPIYKYFEKKYGITNLFLIDISQEARAIYTNTSNNEFQILQIVLEVYESHKKYEKIGGYNRH